MRRRVVGLIRLVHPFPSILDGLVTAAIALVAGGGLVVAATLGIAMTALQFSIGAVNDVVDADRDVRNQPTKPIPAGVVPRDQALAVAIVALATGLVLSAALGPAVLLVALAGAGVGVLYDVALKGTAWAWLAYALGIPLLPVYAWLGATGSLPAAFLVLVPIAALEGAALALANPLADVDHDRRSGTATPAVRLGMGPAWRVTAILQGLTVVLAVGSLLVLAGGDGPRGLVGGSLVLVGSVIVAVGVGLSRPDRVGRLPRRQLGWELQAFGASVIAVGWVLAVLVGRGG